MKHTLLWLFLCCSLFFSACADKAPLIPLKITGFTLKATAPSTLASWYEQNLGFQSETVNDKTVLTLNNSTLNIIANSDSQASDDLKTPLRGFFKIGFKVSDIDKLYARLLANGADFKGRVFHDTNLQTRSLVALDPEGNRVQFFEDTNVAELEPCFFSIMAVDFEKTLAWCESAFGFEQLHVLDLPEQGMLIRLMQKDGVLLELISNERVTADGAVLTGIDGIGFNRSGLRNGEGILKYMAP